MSSTFLFDNDVKQVLHIAQQIAKENLHPHFGAPHLLRALLHKDIGLIPLFKNLGKDYYYIEEWADVRLETCLKSAPVSEPDGDETVKEILREADDIRLKLQKDSIDPLCLLASVITPGVGFNFDQLKSFPLKREELIESGIDNILLNEILGETGASNKTGKPGEAGAGGALLKYCINKTAKIKEGKTDAIVGRDNELRMMAEILCRRSKPNVMLIGEPGVGKSALVDGFALAVAQQKVPAILLNAQIFELDNGALIAGASYKGEIEDRLKNILKEIKGYDKAILFIDEIHILLDKHGAAGGAANMLKPELARGEITIIGATTIEEYKKHIENDEAFNRRFELVKIDEPDETVAFQMLRTVIPYYEQHHGITAADEVIQESIRLAKRYIKDRKLPDAAIDLIDRTMSALRMLNDTGLADIERLEQTISEWKEAEAAGEPAKDLADWKWLCRSFVNKISPILSGQFSSEIDPQQLELKEDLVTYLDSIITDLRQLAKEPRTILLKTDTAAIVSNKTGIPLGKLQAQEQERLLNMEAIIKKRVVGQDHAVKAIAEAILESRSGLGKPGQPIGSFFFLGPTGTGKTELAKSLAEFLFQDESFMIRFDMSEFKEEHSAALLYGAPPGYVGYEEGGLLVNKIRRQPYSVVLFDEIEKAHPSVFDVFLQMMDEGKLHDKLGKEGDFSNALILFTSNIGSNFVVDKFNKGEIPASNQLMEIMSNHFRPEFLGRLTEIIPFGPMKQETVRGILDIHLKGLFAALQKQGISLDITEAAKEELALQGFTPAYGARPLGGVIRTLLRRPLSKKIISGAIKAGSRLQLTLKGNDLEWITLEEAKA
jgi:ATP-dependent Clp protease ATP-binding subunit ClpB